MMYIKLFGKVIFININGGTPSLPLQELPPMMFLMSRWQ